MGYVDWHTHATLMYKHQQEPLVLYAAAGKRAAEVVAC